MVRVFGHYIPRMLLALAAAEAALMFAAFMVGVHIRFDFGGDVAGLGQIGPLLPKGAVYSAVMMGALMVSGLYSRHFRDASLEMILRILVAFVFGMIGLVLLFYLLPDLFVGRGALALVLGLSAAGIIAVRLSFIHFVDLDALKRRILVLGTGDRAAVINRLMRRKSDRQGISIVGYVHLSRDRPVVVQGAIVEHDRPLPQIARDLRVHEIVVAVDDRRRDFPLQEIVACRMEGLDVLDLASFIERQAGKILLENLHPSWLIFSEGFNRGALRGMEKRLFDVTTSLFLLVFAWPVMILISVAIMVEGRGRGPVLYRQMRVGEHGHPFPVLKFRSMTVDAEKNGVQWASKNDSRITRIGAFIRKYRFDELPQLFNVLVGQMSFVGPRPERPEFVDELSKKIAYYAERHRVKPGITGWAQICYPYGASEKDALEKLQYDLYYVKNYTVFLDLVILLQTAQAVIWGKGGR